MRGTFEKLKAAADLAKNVDPGDMESVLAGDLSMPKLSAIANTLDANLIDEVCNSSEEFRPILMAAVQARAQIEHATAECRTLTNGGAFLLYGAVNLNGLRQEAEIPVIIRILDCRTDPETLLDFALPNHPQEISVSYERGKIRLH